MIHRAGIARRMTEYNIISGHYPPWIRSQSYPLGRENFWTDEANSVIVAKLAVPEIVATFETGAYPLDYIIVHYWTNLFGTSEFAVRFLSLIFGVLTIPMIYLLGRRVFNEEVGLISAFVLAISQINTQYSQDTRMYSMLLFLALLSM